MVHDSLLTQDYPLWVEAVCGHPSSSWNARLPGFECQSQAGAAKLVPPPLGTELTALWVSDRHIQGRHFAYRCCLPAQEGSEESSAEMRIGWVLPGTTQDIWLSQVFPAAFSSQVWTALQTDAKHLWQLAAESIKACAVVASSKDRSVLDVWVGSHHRPDKETARGNLRALKIYRLGIWPCHAVGDWLFAVTTIRPPGKQSEKKSVAEQATEAS